ncbi:MAG: [Fe-Fe] hydrogenase large subunit C-terminal domain-containing protein [Thermodesulfobacteriota bacterium]
MAKENPRDREDKLSVYIHKAQCNGCVVCVRACPTKALRVRNGIATVLPELCVDCGECIRVCPRDAVQPRVSTYKDLARFKVTALLPSPVLYTQFGDDIYPNDVLLALTKLGFNYVFDESIYCEWCNLAVADWLDRNPAVRTAISPVCPVVIRLIAKRFPDLIPNIITLSPPREVGAKHIRMVLKERLHLEDKDIGVFHVTPCAAKTVAINHPLALKHSSLNGALGLHELYGDLLQALKELTPADHETMLFKAGGSGIGWEMSGGEVAGLRQVERTLSVSGLSETIEVLEQIESDQLHDVRYVECRVCQDGCVGGPLTVENRYRARSILRRLVDTFGRLPRVRPKDIKPMINRGFFELDKEIKPILFPLDRDPLKAILKLRKADEITARLPGKLCAVCGAPDCRTLAEDVVLGKAKLTDCPFYEV